jgi:acyl carrier protein
VTEIFDIPEEKITDALSSKDIPKWDSINHLMFVAELEKEFGVSFSMDEVLNAKTLGDLRLIVNTRRKK